MRKLTMLLTKELEVVELGHKIQSDIQREMEKNQREFYLRQQLRAIQEELGEVDPQQAENNELRNKIDEAKMPEDVKKAADRELDRLSKVPQASPEYSVIRTYLDWLVQLPWSAETPDHIDIRKAREILDEDHYDLEKIKDRIIEYLAVGKLKKKLTGPILCFVGPPGVGKTSLGQSIARAMGRKFVRLSVGGVRDEAEIRGHRRTYIGAMPGTIVRAMRDAGTKNPVMMIDEIDKVGADFRGDPQSALLEVLDPEQNNSFRDHYLDLPFDLSQVLFICTANSLDTISPPLRDRMEIIQLSGYTELEKLQIAKRYLVKKQRNANGLKETQAQISDAAMRCDHQRLHARSRRSQSRTRDRHGLPQGRAQDRGIRSLQGARETGEPCRLPEQAALLQRSEKARRLGRRGDGHGVDAGRRRHPLHRDPGDAGHGQARADRTAG